MSKPRLPGSAAVHRSPAGFDGASASGAPTVSIGMPVYNGARFVAEAIESVLSQEFTDFELIIADNASTDGTEEICRRYAEKDNRIKIARHPRNIGAAKNYNYTFHCAAGEYFSWLAHDDLLRPGFLSTCLAGYEVYKNAPVLVYPNFVFVNEKLEEVQIQSPFVHAVLDSPVRRFVHTLNSLKVVTSIFGLFRRDVLARTRLIGGFVDADYVLLAECALLGKIVRLDGEAQFVRRIHAQSSRSANKTMEEVAVWFDPHATIDMPPARRLVKEYTRSVFFLDNLTLGQRLHVVAHLRVRRARRKVNAKVGRLLRFAGD